MCNLISAGHVTTYNKNIFYLLNKQKNKEKEKREKKRNKVL